MGHLQTVYKFVYCTTYNDVLINCPIDLRTFALIVCAQRYCAGNATVICHALLRALVKLRF